MEHLLYCPLCKLYTLEKTCPNCKKPTLPPRPPKYSPVDKYAPYRREVKKEELKKKGLY